MKRIRVSQAPSALLRARLSQASSRTFLQTQVRCQSTTEAVQAEPVDAIAAAVPDLALPENLPSPHPDRALRSAKLAALHARLYLSSKVPVQTLARCLVDPSADAHPRFNNANLAFLGSTVVQYHTSEWLIAHYPRLPMAILFAAMKGYAGVPALHQVSKSWGVEQAYSPGGEVDPGLLQFTDKKPTVVMNRWGYVRAESKEIAKYKWRRGMSSRVMYDDAFGDEVSPESSKEQAEPEINGDKNTKDVVVQDPAKNAHANMVRAVIGAIYLHHGRDAAHEFVKAHVLSRRLDLSNLFEFRLPTRELARLCAREDFEAPVARLLNETGRMSRTPVFVVGIYSGQDKLGEGSGPSLDSARIAAAINTLKSWYLYSPGDRVPVPSDTFVEDAPKWTPVHVDIGEIIS